MMGETTFHSLRQVHIDWLIGAGVEPLSIVCPNAIDLARGARSADGIFEPAEDGPEWLAFHENAGNVFWHPKTGKLATSAGNVFALGTDEIGNPGVTALGGWLRVHPDPLEWLRSGRRGIVVIRWPLAFDQLRDVKRIAVHERLLTLYRKWMRPPHMPALAVIPESKAVAA